MSSAASAALLVMVGALVVAALVLGRLVALAPGITAGAAVLAIVVAAVLRSTAGAVAVVVAAFYFDGYLGAGPGPIDGTKLLGALAIAAWIIDRSLRRRRPIRFAPQLWWIGVLLLWTLVSASTAVAKPEAVATVARYAMFAALFFVVVQVSAGSRRDIERLVDVSALAATASACVGLALWIAAGPAQAFSSGAQGPVDDPNDFGFLLATALPLAVWRYRVSGSRGGRIASAAGVLVIAATLLATLSRGAIVSVVAVGAWAVLTGRVSPRRFLPAMLVIACIAGAVVATTPSLVSSALEGKSQVAAENASSRVYYWRIAVRQFEAAPLTGVGPGNYLTRFPDFGLPFDFGRGPQTTHNTYLNVLAELGAPGLVAFCGFLAVSWGMLRCRARDPSVDALQSALAATFLTALVASLFLTEQFYPPIWFTAALGYTHFRLMGGSHLRWRQRRTIGHRRPARPTLVSPRKVPQIGDGPPL